MWKFWVLLIVIALLPIGYGIVMAQMLGWGGKSFPQALLTEPLAYIPIGIGSIMIIIVILWIFLKR
jgi:hypothetical protein